MQNGSEYTDPVADVTLAGSSLYGTADSGTGDVYSIGLDGSNFNALHVFQSSGGDGQSPAAGLTLVGSTLYGVTQLGGANGDGAIFTMNPDGSNYHILYSFGSATGQQPVADLIQVGSELYGTTERGGQYG